jgi:hypothetical protein
MHVWTYSGFYGFIIAPSTGVPIESVVFLCKKMAEVRNFGSEMNADGLSFFHSVRLVEVKKIMAGFGEKKCTH